MVTGKVVNIGAQRFDRLIEENKFYIDKTGFIMDKSQKAFIFEFKVLDPDEDEITLEDTLANAHAQIEEKQYEAELLAEGFSPAQIHKYGFAFQGKKCLIG